MRSMNPQAWESIKNLTFECRTFNKQKMGSLSKKNPQTHDSAQPTKSKQVAK